MVFGDGLLDGDGGDVLAAGDDDVLLAVPQFDVAVPDRFGDEVVHALPSQQLGLLVEGELLPPRLPLADHVGPVELRGPVDVDRADSGLAEPGESSALGGEPDTVVVTSRSSGWSSNEVCTVGAPL